MFFPTIDDIINNIPAIKIMYFPNFYALLHLPFYQILTCCLTFEGASYKEFIIHYTNIGHQKK